MLREPQIAFRGFSKKLDIDSTAYTYSHKYVHIDKLKDKIQTYEIHPYTCDKIRQNNCCTRVSLVLSLHHFLYIWK